MRRQVDAPRNGTALLIALVLLALVSALLPGATAAARAMHRSQASAESSSRMQAAWRNAAATALSPWNPAADQLAVGSQLFASAENGNVRTTVTTTRLTSRTFALDVEATFAPDSLLAARRRVRILVSHAESPDSISTATPPKPLGRWPVADIF